MENNKKGHNTLVVFHYGGHGANHLGVIQAVLNDKEPKKQIYPIERGIRDLSKLPGVYLIALLDCCRSNWDAEIFRKSQN